MNGRNKIGRVLVPNSICLRRDAKFRSGLIIYREKSKLFESLDQVLRVTRVKFLRYDPFQAKFRRVMAILGKSQSVNTANAKG